MSDERKDYDKRVVLAALAILDASDMVDLDDLGRTRALMLAVDLEADRQVRGIKACRA